MTVLRSIALGAFCIVACGAQPRILPSDTIQGYLAQYQINVEEHFTTTDDGYILRLFRLPRPGAPVVLLQHGILCSSWVWLVNAPERSLGIVLWRMGYDVWLPNSRGNMFSRNHTRLRPMFDRDFWDFTFDDMGMHDVVANVRHVLEHTSNSKLVYFGWSQGTTQMFIGATAPACKAYLEEHISLFVALSPVSYLANQSSLVLGAASTFGLATVLSTAWPYGIFDFSQLPGLSQWFCDQVNGTVCKIGVDTVCGTSALDNPAAIDNMAAHFPAGTSAKDFNHYQQFINKERFGWYDYGLLENLVHYKRVSPPDFPTKKLGIKTAFLVGAADDLGDPKDVAHLLADLHGNPNIVYSKTYDGFSHVTWFTGKTWEWFDDVKALLSQFSPLDADVLVV